MHAYIAKAIVQGVEAAFQCKSQSASLPPDPLIGRQDTAAGHQLGWQEHTSLPHSVPSEDSILEKGEVDDQELSEDENLTPDKPAFTGLFMPSLFKSLLYKATDVTNMGGWGFCSP